MTDTTDSILASTDRSTVKRLAPRGSYERELIEQILDEGLICHVGFVVNQQPFVIPTGYGRDGDRLYIHGSPASRMLQTLQQGVEVCVTVTLLDGLVLARSLFHHSMNYRSVVLFGRAVLVEDEAEKLKALHILSEHLTPGRWQQSRQPNPQELKATTVLMLPIREGSAKVRSGPPVDSSEDYNLSVWAGEIPLKLTAGEPVADPQLDAAIAIPDNVAHYSRTREGA